MQEAAVPGPPDVSVIVRRRAVDRKPRGRGEQLDSIKHNTRKMSFVQVETINKILALRLQNAALRFPGKGNGKRRHGGGGLRFRNRLFYRQLQLGKAKLIARFCPDGIFFCMETEFREKFFE